MKAFPLQILEKIIRHSTKSPLAPKPLYNIRQAQVFSVEKKEPETDVKIPYHKNLRMAGHTNHRGKVDYERLMYDFASIGFLKITSTELGASLMFEALDKNWPKVFGLHFKRTPFQNLDEVLESKGHGAYGLFSLAERILITKNAQRFLRHIQECQQFSQEKIDSIGRDLLSSDKTLTKDQLINLIKNVKCDHTGIGFTNRLIKLELAQKIEVLRVHFQSIIHKMADFDSRAENL